MCTVLRKSWIVVLIAGCGRPPPPQQAVQPAPNVDAAPSEPVPLERDLPTLALRGSKLLQELAQALTASGQDCALATTKIREVTTAHSDVIAANAKVIHDGRERELKAALAPHDETMDAAAKTIMSSPVLASCAQDPEFAQALGVLSGAPK